jgi:hypothetical protein
MPSSCRCRSYRATTPLNGYDLDAGFRIYTFDRFHFDTALEQIADLDEEQASLLLNNVGAATLTETDRGVLTKTDRLTELV